MAMVIEQIPEHAKKISEYASRELGLNLTEYKKRIVFGPDGIAGMFFVPHRLGEKTVFIRYENNNVGAVVKGKYQEVSQKLLLEHIDVEDCETDWNPEGESWQANALKGASMY